MRSWRTVVVIGLTSACLSTTACSSSGSNGGAGCSGPSCGGGEGSGDGAAADAAEASSVPGEAGRGPASVPEFCAQKAQAECQYVVPVCAPLTESVCVSYRTTACTQDASAATSSGARTFNSSNVAACLSAIQSTYGVLKVGQNTTLSYAGIRGGPTGTSTVDYLCELVFPGNVPANGPCSTDLDCANGSVCTPATGGSTTHVCAPLSQVLDGASCADAGDVCVSGDECKRSATGEYLCEAGGMPLGGKGEPCASDAQCDPATAGFCDIYTMAGCQPGYVFGGGKDCEAYGLASGG
jgi:hypothetical protein